MLVLVSATPGTVVGREKKTRLAKMAMIEMAMSNSMREKC
jgi:hypothetical protein